MKKIMYGCVAALVLTAVAHSPAHASGTGQDGPVGIGVIGSGLRVDEVRATLDGWEDGAKARVSLWKGRVYQYQVRGWKYMSAGEARGVKYELAKWKIDKRFPHNSKLCVEVSGYDGRLACAKIHR
ncbi:hypothetical protein ACFC7A_27025 [Streptomyces niveus]|uniref:hypothetical protein n=1 Tax=Streptomyces niveus TaxID=193462 RepID=UPI0035E34E1E